MTNTNSLERSVSSKKSMENVAVKRPSTLAQYHTLLKKDLMREFHTHEMVSSMGLYALLVIIIFGAAFAAGARDIDLLKIGGGLIWVLIVFTSLLGLNRSFTYETEQGCLEGIMLVPLDRSVIFFAKATANLLFLLVVEAIAVPLFYFFFLTGAALPVTLVYIFGPIIIGTIGIAGVGTLLATMTVHTRSKDVLLAVLFIPLLFPLLYSCVSATTAALIGGEFWLDGYTLPLVLSCAYDIVMLSVSWFLYDYVLSV